MRAVIEALQALRGVAKITAVSIVAEVVAVAFRKAQAVGMTKITAPVTMVAYTQRFQAMRKPARAPKPVETP